ncbi:hypothetical protein A2767_03475 [Candidatus Roizmanbacteria bacterium RIFCSPHIGHO2_01_FULL_35_10]|uniref:Uncharacterized protein n=1 Tax=Candidatus Roizmanbacteria bacterium RIFCSPLOWO2_01_FULL_35_13 TaxID=1802055 RepID=A0A1F7IES2_9BACT|nr:MAG: hypothetical protein A2767_03475 [Candidatus Roizmanbacteria bacterium RIFCSPHIGHO2_01_FULL_35_10]OGK41862.1 MAG: hypothetical protein A3A74_02510 [Candidatus Roizmanbacteria bacterium RIFCSPLOWO2_01_FULL_35_13]
MKTSGKKSKKQSSIDIAKIVDKLTDYVNFRLENFDKLQDEFLKHKDFVTNNLDWLVKAYVKYEQEYTIMSAKYIEFSDRLNALEEKIKLLEKKAKYGAS